MAVCMKQCTTFTPKQHPLLSKLPTTPVSESAKKTTQKLRYNESVPVGTALQAKLNVTCFRC